MPNSHLEIKKSVATFSKVLKLFPEFCYVGDPVLRTACTASSLEAGVAIGKKLGAVLLQYRKVAGYGRGLAAPQIGSNLAVFVTFLDEQIQMYINPSIVSRSKETSLFRELCLSTGMMAADVERPDWIIMSWTDQDGQHQQQKFDGFLARLYQHELAHLRGVVSVDEAQPGGISFLTFDPLQEKLRKR